MKETMIASYASVPVVVDGLLDDAVWKTARSYRMHLGKDQGDSVPEEGGEVMLAWDNDYLYIGARLHDSDIYQEGDSDQMHFYNTGDLLEVFLKPQKSPWYWELYATPNNKRTAFFFPRKGDRTNFENRQHLDGLDIRVASFVKGSFNNRNSRDEYWTVEMAVPVKGLCRYGDSFGKGSEWRILVSRYNHSGFLKKKSPELSMVPRLSATNFHLVDEYGFLELGD